MASWLKSAALWGMALLASWGAVGATWLLRSHEPSSSDLFWGLIAFPALLAASYFLLKWALGTILNPSSLAPAPSAEGSSGGAVRPAVASSRSPVQVLVLGGAVKVSSGDAQALLQACTDGIRPELDSQLRDEQGFPVLAARVAALDEADVLDWWAGVALDEELPQGRAWVLQLSISQQRELRLLAEVLAESMMDIEQHAVPALEDCLRTGGSGLGTDQMKSLRDVIPAIKVQLFLEPSWAEGDEVVLLAWARAWLAQVAPGLRFEVAAQRTDTGSEAQRPMAFLSAGSATAEKVGSGPGDREQIWILAAAHSRISPSEVDGLAARGQLFSARRREGLIVGEGAAALVLMHQHPDARSAIFGAGLPFPCVGSAMSVQSSGSADELMRSLLVPVLTASNIDACAVSKIVSDTDHRVAPTMRTAMLVSQQFPDLSLEDDCCLIGLPCGHIGEVAALAAWVLAAELSIREQQPTLALTFSQRASLGAALFCPSGKALVTADGSDERSSETA